MRDPLEGLAEDDAVTTVFRDVILLALIGFVAIVIMLLPHIRKAETEAQDHKAPGNVIVEMHWPSDQPFDVDLWVKGPNSSPVGFWNKGNQLFNLLRDDLGGEGDATEENYEISYSRGVPSGEYVVNAHMYGQLPAGQLVNLTVVVSTRNKYDLTRQILKTSMILSRKNEEKTAFRFRLDDEAELIRDSVSTLNTSLIRMAPGKK